MERPDSVSSAFKAGDMIAGRYRLVSELGRGSMGVVYKAVHEEMRRDVALKTLLPHAAVHPRLVGRFKREVQVISKLRHPNTVTIYDYGSLDDGTLYFAMEMLEGMSLGSAIRRHGPMTPERVRHICAQILKSLIEAHSKGVIHRDLKPDNIFLEEIGPEHDFVKVLDFSIAKALQPEEDTKDLTGAGVTVGTPVYMAPEQFNREEVTPATDLYALGHMMYEMLGGRPIFQGASWFEIAMHKMEDKPVKLRDDIVCSDLGGVLVKAIQAEPRKRYQSAAEMLADLDSVGDLSRLPALPHARDVTSMKADTHQMIVDTPFGPRAVTGAFHQIPLPAPEPEASSDDSLDDEPSEDDSQDSGEATSILIKAMPDDEDDAPRPQVPPMERTAPGFDEGGGVEVNLDAAEIREVTGSDVVAVDVLMLEEVSLDDLGVPEGDFESEATAMVSSGDASLEPGSYDGPDEPLESEATAVAPPSVAFAPPPIDPMTVEPTRVEPGAAMLTPHQHHLGRVPQSAAPQPAAADEMDPQVRRLLLFGMVGLGMLMLLSAVLMAFVVFFFNPSP